MHEILQSSEVLASSVALDSSTHRCFLHLAIRVRFNWKYTMNNLHVASVTMFEQHTAANIFNLTLALLNSIYSSWRHKLICIDSDGAKLMTGRTGRIFKKLRNDVFFPVHRTWCMLHQIDVVAKAHLNALFDGEFLKIVNRVANSLREQETLIREMGGIKCPKLTTRWMAMRT